MTSPDNLSTAEAASRWRALQTLHLDPPAFVDDWAVNLLPADERDALRGAAGRAEFESNKRGWAMSGVGVGCLLFGEDVVLSAVESGIDQYVILGAGFDTFAMRHPELAGRLTTFEVDHPDVQRLKRERLAAAHSSVLPYFVPVDFENTSLSAQLLASPYDATRPAVVSWLNTLPYLTPEAIESTLAELANLTPASSILVCNYPSKDVPITDEQRAVLRGNRASVAGERGEPFQSRFTPDEFVALLAAHGFTVIDHLTEHDLNARYYANRTDGFCAGVPARIITARREN